MTRIIIPKPGAYLDDSGLIVIEDAAFARRFLQTGTGSSAGASGASGAVPGGAAGSQRRALRGDLTYDTELELSSVVKADGTKMFDFDSLGDAGDRFYAAAAASGTHKARLGFRSSIDTWGDIQLEPLLSSAGLVTREGDPLPQTMKPMRALYAVPGEGTMRTQGGMPTPTIYSPGAAPTNLLDANGNYCSLTYDLGTNAACGISTPNFIERQQEPVLLMVFRSAMTQSRFWFGLFDADPSGLTTLGSIKGVGIRFDNAIDSNKLQLVTSNGSSQTTTNTGLDPTANAIQAYRLQHLGSGTWLFALYDFVNTAWTGFVTNTTNSPAGADVLGIHAKLTTTTGATASRVFSPKGIFLFGK